MSDEDTLIRAHKAQAELSETSAAFETMRATAIAAWMASKDHETAFREGLYRAVNVIDAVHNHLLGLVQSAEMADFAETIRAATEPK